MTLLLPIIVLMQSGKLQLAPLFSDGCVLQRNVPVRVWGTATPGASVEVGIDEEERVATIANSNGNWDVQLPPHAAGRSHTLVVNSTRVRNVVFGEVWLCSGQSNMEWSLALSAEAKTEIPGSANPMVRMFNVPKATSDNPLEQISGGHWMEADPKTSGQFSAVGYFFAKALQKELGVPIGMIHTSWGGTRIEAWTNHDVNRAQGVPESEFLSRAALAEKDPNLKRLMERWKAAGSPEGGIQDPGRKSETKGWEFSTTEQDPYPSADALHREGDAERRPNEDELNREGDAVRRPNEGWGKANAPGEWSSLGIDDLYAIDGGVWFRKEFNVPESWAGKPAKLSLGAIDDYDTTFVNGVKVGATGSETPAWWIHPRNYSLPAGTLKAGTNLLAIRIWDVMQGGGLVGQPEQLYLEGPGGERIPLAGEWEYRIETAQPEPFGDDPNTASTLYNAMLHPLRKYTVKGAIWYQGESNADKPAQYATQLPAMIEDWRAAFENPDLSFLAVQLAPYQHEGSNLTAYALLREAIASVRERTRNADSVVITDVGDELDIHPQQKGPVGKRLALLAASMTYGKDVYAHGPRLHSAQVEGGKVTVKFDHVGLGLTIKGGLNSGQAVPSDRLVGFQIAGDDLSFVDAEATITGKDTVEVRSDLVKAPKYVRFGFVNFPKVNLWSRDGLPAEPFRTDRS